MNYQGPITDDPIIPELLRSRLEAIAQEAADAVEQTAISPIVTESKDYSITILDADGSVVSAKGLVVVHFGAVMHAVRSTISTHGDTIADGDVFIANDPHSGGGVHPQDIVIQRPVFVEGVRVAWVALSAHMMDMGGMVPGSSSVNATECYQEALRLPPVRLIRRGEECEDIWNIMRINIRSSDLIEMDIRSLVIGSGVAEAKLVELIGEMGVAEFRSAAMALLAGVERVLRERIALLEDGTYRSTAWIEWSDDLLRVPCSMEVRDQRVIFDLTDTPDQVPFFFNSKDYIVRAAIAPRMLQILAPGLPFNQPVLDVVEIISRPGTIVNSTMPAPIAAAHMDATMAVTTAVGQCLEMALHTSPQAKERDKMVAPALAAYGTVRWTYLDEMGARRVYTLIDGTFCGSPAASDRDGIDITPSRVPGGTRFEYADAEILEAVYPLLVMERRASTGRHGYGRYRSGAGCKLAFRAHNTESLIGNMTGTRSWFPSVGAAGGYPGATMRYALRRQDGSAEPVGIHQAGVALAGNDVFEMTCASGGGFGDPLDRDPMAVWHDLCDGRVVPKTAQAVYGVELDAAGKPDEAATMALRDTMRRDRLSRAAPAKCPADAESDASAASLPIYPGVHQRGNLAVAEESGAVLAIAPGNWLDGCPTWDMPVDERGGGVVARAHLDPLTGQMLFIDVLRKDDGPSIEIRTDRWSHALP